MSGEELILVEVEAEVSLTLGGRQLQIELFCSL